MRNKLLVFACICLCTAAAAQTGSHAVYVADPRIHVHKLQGVTTLLVDSLNRFSHADVISGKLDARFQPVTSQKEMFEPGKNYWLRFSIAGTAAFNNWWLMLTSADRLGDYAQHQQMDVYQVMNGDLMWMSKGGMFVPRAERAVKEIPAINRVYFSMITGDTQVVYVRVYDKFGESSPVPTIELRRSDTPVPPSPSSIDFVIGSSVMMTLSILSLVFFFFVRDKAYLFFSGYSLFLALHYQVLNPSIPLIDLLIPEHPHLISLLWTILTMGSIVFFLLFGRSFISLPRLSKKTDTLLKWFIGVWIAVTVADMLVLHFFGSQFVNRVFIFMLFVLMFVFMVRMAFFKNILARLFVAGALWLTVFFILGRLWNDGLWLPVNPWFTGQFGQLLIYCFGLAYKIRLNEQAKAEADHIKDVDQIKSRFFANISHEFRTPLTLIRGPLQQIEEQAAGRKEDTHVSVPRHKIKIMRRHTDRLLELVNQLLDLSRLDSGKMKLQVGKGDVVQVLKALAASFESMAERKQIHYHLHFTEQSRIAFFDRDKLEKIVTNLLGNAFKYTPEKGSVALIVETDEQRLRLSVEDSGPGIAKKELDKVFDRFYQSEGNESKGTGIGLALVKELTDLYRGQISVSSDPGKGSRFRVSLPVDIASFKEDELYYKVEESETQASITNKEVATTPSIVTAKHANANLPLLLVVEDNTDLRDLIVEIVHKEYQVIEAVNGKEGYDKAVQEIPDLVI
ncbi:MAG TPA: ATP-binding protein, partial [Chitinophagaceae bacterium]|nr:ATP-binding protein [Chitinophagaceae bacterium]